MNFRTAGSSQSRAYTSLGDSYSSGLGAEEKADDYKLGKDCRRSSKAWAFRMQSPLQVATKLVACQGDTLSTGVDGGVRKQLAAIRPFFAAHPSAAQLVTVTVGGNDVGFSKKLKQCVFSNCATNETDWTQDIDAMFGSLHSFYNDLRDAAPNADIVVGGYPHVLQVGGKKVNAVCLAIGGSEREMMGRLVDQLNDVIWRASAGSVRTGRYKTTVWSVRNHV